MPRRKPFSNKQKKIQLQEKRLRKKEKGAFGDDDDDEEKKNEVEEHPLDLAQDDLEGEVDLVHLHSQPTAIEGEGLKGGGTRHNPNRFCLHFEKESDKEIKRRKFLAKTTPILPVPESQLEVGVADIYKPGSVLDIPHRPSWSYSMSKTQVEAQEERAFATYLKDIYSQHSQSQLSYFEHNLETWRQLWRVLEISNVILLITDIRHPVLHFSPALYNYVIQDLKKELILVLNKVDLVPPQVCVAWRHYFLSHFPQLEVICFTSYPNPSASPHVTSEKIKLKRRRGRSTLPSAVGPRELLRLVEKMYSGKVDTKGWRQKLEDVSCTTTLSCEDDASGSDGENDGELSPVTVISSLLEQDKVSEGVLTIGMVGHPNVGKSSIINGLMAKKVVSTSRTPGHTKHFQTLYLTPTIRLCDCPGLVFPSLVDKQLQILSGIYPIAQVREPYTAVGYLAQRTPLTQWLQLVHPEDSFPVLKRQAGPVHTEDREKQSQMGHMIDHVTQEREWTAWDICDAWAEKRGYYTPKAARPDTYRAANSILRLAVDGKISMYFRPPGYSQKKVEWEGHPEVAEIIRLQQAGMGGSLSRPADMEGEDSDVEGGDSDVEGGAETGRGKVNNSQMESSNKFAVLADVGDSDA